MPSNPRNSHPVEKIIVVVVIIAAALFALHFVFYSMVLAHLQGASQYWPYAVDLVNALIAVIGAYVIYRVLVAAATSRAAEKREDAGMRNAALIILRIIFYIIAIAIVLDAFGVSLTGVLAGSAIGGIILGLAVQTVVTNILSGFLISSSKTLRVGDPVIVKTFFGEYVGEVSKVSTIWTEITNQNGSAIRIANSILMGNAVFTKMHADQDIIYPVKVTISSDVPAKRLMDLSKPKIAVAFEKKKMPAPRVYLISKDGSTNSFQVNARLNRFADLNDVVSAVNSAFDSSYWELKKAA